MSKVIALVGMPGSGKSSCIDHLVERGWPKVYFGGVVVDEVQARGLEVNETNERAVREEFRAQDGLAAIAKRIIPKIDAFIANGSQVVIADGLYGWTEYKTLYNKYGDDLLMIAITAPKSLRHARLAQRPVRPLTEAQVQSRDIAEIENLEKGGPIAYADYTIVNDGTPQAMLTKLDDILATENIR